MNQKVQFEDALSHLRSGNVKMAAELCDINLKRYPADGNFMVLAAQANLALKNFAIAEAHIEAAIRQVPDLAMAHETYGDLLLVQGRHDAALAAYEQAMRLDPTRAATHDKIARATELQRSMPGGQASRAPRGPDAELMKARELEKNGDVQAAEMIYRDILKRDPRHVEAARLLAGIAVRNKRFRDAEVFLRQVVRIAPDYTRAWVDLAHAQRERDHLEDAMTSAKRVLELAPDNADSHVLYASIAGLLGDHEAAIRAYQVAIDMAPQKAGAMTGMAHHQKTIGRQDDAVASYRQAIAVKPDHAEAYWSLANLKTFRFEDHEVAAMETLLLKDELPDDAKSHLHNALGLEYEGRKQFDQAFSHFSRCNEIRRQSETYDPVDTESTYGRIIDMFTPAFMSEGKAAPPAAVTPILIVGLPRSGSTLIEQILASHSQVDGTHELGDLARSVQTVRKSRRGASRFPDALADFDRAAWERIGREYLSRTEIHRGDAPYFVDKNPNNFIYAGVLRLALPNVRIINARRHPLDSCLGSFKQLFASGQPFTYDLTELGEYYVQYQRLMDHWHEVLPGFVLDVDYENVVAGLEVEVRRLLDFCGLPFEEACLRFHETERAVKTASSEQVRQPIYSSSVDLWRNYEPHLAELVHILEPLLRRPQEVPRDS